MESCWDQFHRVRVSDNVNSDNKVTGTDKERLLLTGASFWGHTLLLYLAIEVLLYYKKNQQTDKTLIY